MNRHSLSCSRLASLTVAAVLTHLLGLSLFIFGFFPVKPALSGISGPESFRAPWDDAAENQSALALPPDQLRRLYQDLAEIPMPFDRLIFMVIDGLPAEFVLGRDGSPPKRAFHEAMPYTQSLLSSGVAIGFHAKAAPPTVTMPRLKAMVSGAIPGYLDVVYNFNTQALQDDNIIDQLFRTGRKIWMFGDDTWIKLFQGLFDRADGVSSFFVKDTVEVDRNVSRHLANDLMRDDWDIMILHYLGLDHVGHVGGRNSVLMAPKLKEMDEVVKRIHTTQMQDKDKGRTLLVIVSDHGMTEDGNHGGSSFEETDSLALFIGLNDEGLAGGQSDTVDQVDIAATIAALFNVPIPRNNIGVMIEETVNFMPEEHQLRAMELNSWQLLRLLQAQLPGLKCLDLNGELMFRNCSGSVEKNLCCLYQNAAALHKSWKSEKISMSTSRKDYLSVKASYRRFLTASSEWLARRVTDKPVGLLALGVSAMLLASVVLMGLLFHLNTIFCSEGDANLPELKIKLRLWGLDEVFIVGATLGHAISMISSSMVEEEQYNWHFLTSTHCLLLLREILQVQPDVIMQSKSHNQGACCRLYSVLALLISGRILRGWHQGGVNWINLPDISKWLELRGIEYVKYSQIVASVLIISLSLSALSLVSKRRNVVLAIMFALLVPGFSVIKHVIEYQDSGVTLSGIDATLSAQNIYRTLIIASLGTIVGFPWFTRIMKSKKPSSRNIGASTSETVTRVPLHKISDSLYVIGWTQLLCWCLVQLLLQQPINSLPILLLLLQIYFMMLYSSTTRPEYKQWVEVATLYFLGMVGHYSMGNSNSLATIDVAGAFIGTSSYSTLVSGILMFMITFASPMLYLLSILVHISVRDISFALRGSDSGEVLKAMLGFPCLVPLGLNSILMTAYTVVLLLMRNHLFVWSVFSPKFLYIAAMTLCIDAGVAIVSATVTYVYTVVASTEHSKD